MCEWLGVWDNGSRGRHCERLMPKEQVLSSVEHTLKQELNFAAFVLKRALVG